MEPDPELRDFLRSWVPPEPRDGLDERMMARYRSRRSAFWRRRLEFRIVLPAPLFAAAAVLLLLSVVWWIARPNDTQFEPVPAPRLIVTRAEVSR